MNGAALRATGWATVCTDYCVCAVVCRLRVLSVDVPCVVVAQAYVCTALSDHGPNCPCIAALVINWYYGSGGAWVLSWADTRLCVALLACTDDVIAFPPGIVVLVFSRAGCCIPVCATPPRPCGHLSVCTGGRWHMLPSGCRSTCAPNTSPHTHDSLAGSAMFLSRGDSCRRILPVSPYQTTLFMF